MGAMEKVEAIRGFLNQATDDLWDFEQTLGALTEIGQQ